jgi:hypothetical protein
MAWSRIIPSNMDLIAFALKIRICIMVHPSICSETNSNPVIVEDVYLRGGWTIVKTTKKSG